jgi:hypothetical protein
VIYATADIDGLVTATQSHSRLKSVLLRARRSHLNPAFVGVGAAYANADLGGSEDDTSFSVFGGAKFFLGGDSETSSTALNSGSSLDKRLLR